MTAKEFIQSIKKVVQVKVDLGLVGTLTAGYYKRSKRTIYLHPEVLNDEDHVIQVLCHELIHVVTYECGLGMLYNIAWDFIDCRTLREREYYFEHYIEALVYYDAGPEILTEFLQLARRIRRRIRKLFDKEAAEEVIEYFNEAIKQFNRDNI